MLEAKGNSPVGVVREVPELLRIFSVDVLGSVAPSLRRMPKLC